MITCFGTYDSNRECAMCAMTKQCQAFMVSDGLDEAAASIEMLLEELPEREYPPVQTMSRLVAILLDPERAPIPPVILPNQQFVQPKVRTVVPDDLSLDDL